MDPLLQPGGLTLHGSLTVPDPSLVILNYKCNMKILVIVIQHVMKWYK